MKMQLITLILMVEDYMLPCFNKKFLGVECPGCGMQRSVALLIQGDFIAAFKMYPAIYTILLLLGFLLLDNFYKIKYANRISIILMVTSVILILTNYILKFF